MYMGKKRIQWNEQTYLRFLREGRGQGSGQEYIPWIKIHDFPSKGVCSRIYCEKTHRIHHLLSHNEENYFYMLSCDPLVTDIREQFPLRLSETLEIAKRMHIRHPQKGSFPFVLTTDFLISRGDRLEARTIKSAGELQNKRICEKFSIEYAYWKSKGIDWKIVTDRNINKDKALNCRWLSQPPKLNELIPDHQLRSLVQEVFFRLYQNMDIPFSAICGFIEQRYSLSPGNALCIFRHLVLSGRIPLNLDVRINPLEPRTAGGI